MTSYYWIALCFVIGVAMKIIKMRVDGYYENLVYLQYIIVENNIVCGTFHGGDIDVIMFCVI